METLKRTRGMHGLFMIADGGNAYVAWHATNRLPKDGGQALLGWIRDWASDAAADATGERAIASELRSRIEAFP